VRRRLLFLPLVLALFLLTVFGTGLQCVLGTVSHVVDGDTIDVVADFPFGYGDDCPVTAGQTYRVRLVGVDTPEVYGQEECYGQEASDYVKGLLQDKAVCLMRDTSCTDRYERLLAYVWVDTDPSTPGCELFLNGDLAWQGYGNAMPYPPDTLLVPSIRASECEAYKAGRGMWSACPGLPAPTGCGGPGPEPTPTPDGSDPCGPCAASDCNCSDFSTWQQAQRCLESRSGDPFRLDQDDDGTACESLPGAP
jgi:micrococcal nuclease